MRKKISTLLLLFLFLTLLSACDFPLSNLIQGKSGKNPNTQITEKLPPLKNGESGQPNTDNNGENSPSHTELITELYAEDGSYKSSYGDMNDYSYHLPQIVASTADAAQLNEELRDAFEPKIIESLDEISRGEYAICSTVGWESHWDGQDLHLVVYNDTLGGVLKYEVYHFNFATGKKMSNEEVLRKIGVTPEKAVEAMRRVAAQAFDRSVVEYFSSDYGPESNWLRAQTISRENLDISTARFYPDNANQFTAIIPIASHAGAGWFDEPLSVPLKSSGAKTPKAPESRCEFVKAVLDDDVKIYFEKENPQSEWYETAEYVRQVFGVQYNVPYTVENCYGEYTDIFVGVVGQDFFPYAFLLTQRGTVEYVNLFDGFIAGTLSNGGPVYGIGNIVGFESGTVVDEWGGGYQTVWAIDGQGEKHDMAQILYPVEFFRPFGVAGNWEASIKQGGATHQLYLSLPKEDYQVVFEDENLTTGEPIRRTGGCTYLGMNEDGLIYYFSLYGYEDDNRIGAVVLNPFSSETLHPQLISKEAFWGTGRGEEVTFSRIYN